MAEREVGSKWKIEIADQETPSDVVFDSGSIEGNSNLPDSCVLLFKDPQSMVLDKTHAKIGATLKVSVIGGASPEVVFEGEVTALEAQIDGHNSFTIVRGYDKSHRLHRGRVTNSWPQKDPADVVKLVASHANIPAGTITAVGRTEDLISQLNQTDWAFLKDLCASTSFDFSVAGGKLNFEAPADPTPAAGGGAAAETQPLVLDARKDLVHLRATLSSAEQVANVEVRGWDVKAKDKVSSTAPTATKIATLQDKPADLAKPFGDSTWVGTYPPLGSAAEVKGAASAAAEVIGSAFAELDGVAHGNPKLKAGVTISLASAGDKFNGQYVLTTVRHQFQYPGTYTTGFTVSGTRDRSLLGLTQSPGGRGTMPGVVPGQVTDTKDPNNLGRVKVKFPWMSDSYVSDWARVSFPGGGKDRGFLVVPESGDEVLVAFEQGDLTRPFVLGGLYNGQDAPPDISDVVDSNRGEIKKRVWKSRKGHSIFIDDTDNSEMICVESSDASYLIHLDIGSKQIVISTSDGKVMVKGKEIHVEAQTNLELKGNDLSIKGSTVSLTADGQMTISGATVAIN